MSTNVNSLFNLSGRIALVTGGYGHLGTAISEGLAEAGAKVYILGRSVEKFKAAFVSCLQEDIHFTECDIADTNSIRKAFETIEATEGKLDILVNNAFYSKGQDPVSLTDEEWAIGIDGNLNSTYRCIREVVPYLREKGGSIINVASMYGMVSPDFNIYDASPEFLNPPHYGAAKAGVLQLTKYFACYLGKSDIRVNAVTPGPFPSQTVQRNEEFVKQLKKKNPLGRIGNPQDLKGAFVYLASDASAYMTGQNLVIDGGWTAW